MYVSAFMNKNFTSVAPDTTVQEAARIMLEKDLGALLVINNDGHLKGILTENDYISQPTNSRSALISHKHFFAQNYYFSNADDFFKKARGMLVEMVMTKIVKTVRHDQTLVEVADMMIKQDQKSLALLSKCSLNYR